jgi:hypothetical protein
LPVAPQTSPVGRIHAALWEALEADAGFTGLVAERNRVKALARIVNDGAVDKVVPPRGWKPNLGPGDVPELVIAQAEWGAGGRDRLRRPTQRWQTFSAVVSVNGMDQESLNAVREVVLSVWDSAAADCFGLTFVLGTRGVEGRDLVTADDVFRGAGRPAGQGGLPPRLVSVMSMTVDYYPPSS